MDKFNIQKPEDVVPALEVLRAHAEDAVKRDSLRGEELTRLSAAYGEIQARLGEVESLRAQAAKAEEMAKLASEALRGRDDDEGKAAEQLRFLPFTRRWTPSDVKDTNIGMTHAQYSLLAMTRGELEANLGEGPALHLIRRFRNLNDLLYLTHAFEIQKRIDDPEALNRYLIDERGVRSLKLWPAFERAAKFLRTFDTQTSGAASEWVPTMFSVQYFEDLTMPVGAADLFQWFPVPHNPFGWPMVIHGTTRVVKIIGEGTATNAGGYTNKDGTDKPTSGQLVINVKKIGMFTSISRELDQDSLVNFAPVVAANILLEHGYARSIMVINGQPILTSLGTLDTARSLTAGSDVEDIGSLCTPASWGVRRACHASATPVNFAGGFTAESLAAVIGAAKVAGLVGYSAWVSGLSVGVRALVTKDASNANVYLTKEKAGDLATSMRGQLGILMGRPLVTDAMYPEDLNASGIFDNSVTNCTSIALVRPDRFIGATKQGMMLETSREFLFDRDEVALRSTERVTFTAKRTPSTAANDKCGAMGINVPSYQ